MLRSLSILRPLHYRFIHCHPLSNWSSSISKVLLFFHHWIQTQSFSSFPVPTMIKRQNKALKQPQCCRWGIRESAGISGINIFFIRINKFQPYTGCSQFFSRNLKAFNQFTLTCSPDWYNQFFLSVLVWYIMVWPTTHASLKMHLQDPPVKKLALEAYLKATRGLFELKQPFSGFEAFVNCVSTKVVISKSEQWITTDKIKF